jgi:phosphoenolpyruvate carboxykinase (GTP)
MSDEDLAAVLEVDLDALKLQLPQMREFLDKFGDDLPDEISAQFDALEERLAV